MEVDFQVKISSQPLLPSQPKPLVSIVRKNNSKKQHLPSTSVGSSSQLRLSGGANPPGPQITAIS